MQVRVGSRPTDAFTPAHYQLCVFPAWGAFAAVLARDLAVGRDGWMPRLALLSATGALAVARLAGGSPLSGHAVFLAALTAFELTASRRTPFALPLALGAFGITAFYKFRWGDAAGLARSSALGAAIGALCSTRFRHGRSE